MQDNDERTIASTQATSQNQVKTGAGEATTMTMTVTSAGDSATLYIPDNIEGNLQTRVRRAPEMSKSISDTSDVPLSSALGSVMQNESETS